MSRRLRFLSLLAVASSLGGAAMMACGGGADEQGVTPGADGGGGQGSDGSQATTDGSQEQSDAASFAFPTPIKHVIVIVKENHTFDNFFGEYDGGPGAYPALTAKLHDGTVIDRPKCPGAGIDRDFPHDHASAVQAYNNGAMNGLDLNKNTVHASGGADDYEAYCTFGPINQTTLYWQLIRNYATADHFFANMLAPSFPGHLASAIGKSPAFSNPGCPVDDQSCESTIGSWGCTAPAGTVVSTYDPDTCEVLPPAYPCYDTPTWMDLFPSSLTWVGYARGRLLTGGAVERNPQSLDDAGAPLVGSAFAAVKKHSTVDERKLHFREERQIVPQILATNGPSAAASDGGTVAGLFPDLPNVMFWTDSSSNSEHPPGTGKAAVTPQCGEQDDYDIINAVMSGQHWKDTVVIVTMDDWGGFYDHVKPPVEVCANGQFYSPGFRLPIMIVSAYSKPGFILHDHTEQASIPRLIEEMFGLPLTSVRDPQNRDGKAGSLMGVFDFTQPPRAPVTLTRPVDALCTHPTAPQ